MNRTFSLFVAVALLLAIGHHAWSQPPDGICTRYGLTTVPVPLSPELSKLKNDIESNLAAKGDLRLISTAITSAKGARLSDLEGDWVSVLSGRIDRRYSLDLGISDRQAKSAATASGNSGLIVTQYEPFFCADTSEGNAMNGGLASSQILPYRTESEALGAGLSWQQRDLDRIAATVSELVASCRFVTVRFEFVGKGNNSLRALLITDPRSNDALFFGYASK